MDHPTLEELNDGLSRMAASPSMEGTVELIVLRPEVDRRSVVETAVFSVGAGLAGDNYVTRGNARTADGAAHPEAQVTLMNVHAIDLCTRGDQTRWPLAGDQLFVDLDLSASNLPPGSRLQVGTATLEVSAKPHTGCAKFATRFGLDAAKWINSDPELRLRGINAMVVAGGEARTGCAIAKLTEG